MKELSNIGVTSFHPMARVLEFGWVVLDKKNGGGGWPHFFDLIKLLLKSSIKSEIFK